MPPIVRGKLNLEELQNKSACQKCDYLLFRSMQWQRTSDLSERALRPEAGQGSDEADGNPVHLLRHPHGKRGAAGRQDRTESTAGSLLKRKYAHGEVLSRGNYASVIENGQKSRPKRQE